MAKKKMTKGEKAARKINRQLRSARGVTVEVATGVPEASAKMGSFIRQGTGRNNGRGQRELMKLKRQAMEQGYIINSDGEIIHDVRTEAEKEAQDGN